MPAIKTIEARLPVADLRRSAGFFAATLGFEPATWWPPQAPEFAIVSRDGVRLQLATTPGAAPAACTLWLDVDDVPALHARVKEVAAIEWGPEVYGHGRREFAFRDPDGHLVILSEATSDPASCAGG
jgi:catechol 2,3-dioxygenase-like lactoylglutathione lyase family enzyme